MSTPILPTVPPVKLVGGTHTWNTTTESGVSQDAIIKVMREHGISSLDTARSYGGGESEKTLGAKGFSSEFTIDTKAATGIFAGSGSRENIFKCARESLEALKVEKVRTFFLHAPDESVPVEEQMGAIQSIYEAGKFENFGLSNFTKDGVVEYYNYAKTNGFVLPTVYQSSYSIAIRLNEHLLFPTLRELGISIQAYSPMAAGFLAKIPEDIEQGKGSWDPKTPTGLVYRELYFKPSYMLMLEKFGKLSNDSGVSRVGLAYRWVRFHSVLKSNLGDEIIIGAASAEQLAETLTELEKGPLESWVAKAIDKLWDIIKDDAPVDNLLAIRKIFNPS